MSESLNNSADLWMPDLVKHATFVKTKEINYSLEVCNEADINPSDYLVKQQKKVPTFQDKVTFPKSL